MTGKTLQFGKTSLTPCIVARLESLQFWVFNIFVNYVFCFSTITVKKPYDNGEIPQLGPQAKWKFIRLKEPAPK